METPLHVQQGQMVTGELRLAAHNRQSYDVFVTLTGPPLHPGSPPQQVLTMCHFCSISVFGECLLASPSALLFNPNSSSADAAVAFTFCTIFSVYHTLSTLSDCLRFLTVYAF